MLDGMGEEEHRHRGRDRSLSSLFPALIGEHRRPWQEKERGEKRRTSHSPGPKAPLKRRYFNKDRSFS